LPGSPTDFVNTESVTTRNFTDKEIYMKTEKKEDKSRLMEKILKYQP